MSLGKFGMLGELDSLLIGYMSNSTPIYVLDTVTIVVLSSIMVMIGVVHARSSMSKLKRPKIDFDRTDVDCKITVHFRKTKRAVKFMAKLYAKPPKGIIKL